MYHRVTDPWSPKISTYRSEAVPVKVLVVKPASPMLDRISCPNKQKSSHMPELWVWI
jgi:hypothetical protein